jgi:hypothetical protein
MFREFSVHPWSAPLAILFGTLFLLRLPMIGGPPYADEGFYALNAELTWRGSGSLPLAPISLYPSILHVFGIAPATPFLHLRIADAFVAASAAMVCYLFLAMWTDRLIAFVMAAAWSVAVNLPILVNAGFKNPILAATLVYLVALCFVSSRSRFGPFWAGLILPLSPFLREPFLPFLIVPLFLVIALHDRRGRWLHIVGLALGGSLLLAWLWTCRGSPAIVLGHFSDLSMYYRSFPALGRDIQHERVTRINGFIRTIAWLMPTALPGLGWLLFTGRQQWVLKVTAVMLLSAPLPDILGRPTFYHTCGQILLGIAFMGAMGLSWIRSFGHSINGRRITIAVYLTLAWMVGELDTGTIYRSYRDQFRLSLEFAPAMVWGRWDNRLVNRSFFLDVATFIRDRTNPDDRIVTSGLIFPLYLLSNRMPPSPYVTDLLMMSAAQYPSRRPDLMDEIRRQPPRIVVETLGYFSATVRLNDYWPDFQSRYRLIKKFPSDSSKVDLNSVAVWELKE